MNNINEGIKILEEMKRAIVYDSDEDYDNQIAIRQIQAIENLINGYRELEEKCQRYKKCKDEYNKKYIEVTSLYLNSIPKSKIKEKIEELKKKKKDLLQLPSDCGRSIALEDCDDKIELYKELMEDK